MTTMVDPREVFDPDVCAGGAPFATLAALREHDPVAWCDLPGTPGFWLVTRHADVVAVSRDHDTFASERGTVLLDDNPMEQAGMLTSMDPPRHTRYRALVNRGFTPRRIAGLEPRVRELARRIVDDIAEAGTCDFVPQVSAELPLQVIAELVGIPVEDRDRIFAWSNAIGSMGVEDPEYAPTPDAVVRAGAELFAYTDALVAERRQGPRDDILTALIAAEVDGQRLTRVQLDLFVLLLAVAGNETTRNALSHGMLALTQHPDQRDRLLADPELLPTAVEEVLRWATPVTHFRRTATRDVELGGRRVRAGDWVVVHYLSANRDGAVFDDPDLFDVGREPNPHLAFGGGGAHFCLGAALARLELRVMFEELLTRLPDIEVAGPPDRLRSSFFHGIKHLPVRFTPCSTPAADLAADPGAGNRPGSGQWNGPSRST